MQAANVLDRESIRRIFVAPTQPSGRLKVLTLELYDDKVRARFVIPRGMMTRETTTGMPDGPIELTDDVGTRYEYIGGLGGSSGGEAAVHGTASFIPACPIEVQTVYARTHAGVIEIDLTVSLSTIEHHSWHEQVAAPENRRLIVTVDKSETSDSGDPSAALEMARRTCRDLSLKSNADWLDVEPTQEAVIEALVRTFPRRSRKAARLGCLQGMAEREAIDPAKLRQLEPKFHGEHLTKVLIAPRQSTEDFRVLSVELFDDGLIVHHVALDGPRSSEDRIVRVSDDVGTAIKPESGSGGGCGDVSYHITTFTPPPPPDARTLNITTRRSVIAFDLA